MASRMRWNGPVRSSDCEWEGERRGLDDDAVYPGRTIVASVIMNGYAPSGTAGGSIPIFPVRSTEPALRFDVRFVLRARTLDRCLVADFGDRHVPPAFVVRHPGFGIYPDVD